MSIKRYYKPIFTLSSFLKKVKNNLKTAYTRTIPLIEKRPLASFFSLLILLFSLIIIGNILRKPVPELPKSSVTKLVKVYSIGAAPKIMLNAQIEKSGVVQIVAQTSGIVQEIYSTEGDTVTKGQWIASLSSNYQGGNTLALARQLAEKQNQLVEESYPLQKDLISKQKDLANEQKDNTDKLRDIISKSVDDSQNLVNLNGQIISTLNTNLQNLEASPGGQESLILATKQMKSQFEGANLQLNTALRNAQYQADNNNPVNTISATAHDIAVKQLDIQEKALDLNREISKIQLNLARVNEGIMYPSAPFNGTIEKINVRVGQNVNSGTVVAILSGSGKNNLKATVLTSEDISQKVSKLEPSIITISGKSISVFPEFISTEAVQNNLYSITYQLPDNQYSNLTDRSFVSVQVPLGYPDTPASVPFVPLDAIYQTENDAYLFVERKGLAFEKHVSLGNVMGRFVQVTKGLENGESIILDRTVVSGDHVNSENTHE